MGHHRIKRRPSRRVVAYREAGHAIACHSLGSRVLAVAVSEKATGIYKEGYCLAEFPSSVDGMAMVMAGEIAQLRFDPRSEGTTIGDEFKIELMLSAMVDQAKAELDLTTDDARYAFMLQLRRRCRLAAQREATAIIERHWFEIEALACALVSQRVLDRPSFLGILADCRSIRACRKHTIGVVRFPISGV